MSTAARRAAAAIAALTLAAAAQTAAGASTTGSSGPGGEARWKFYESSFVLRLRAAAVEPALDIPQPLVPGVGYSAVNLEKDVGMAVGGCESRGIGAHLTEVVDQAGPGRLDGEAIARSGALDNPTEARDTKPYRRGTADFDNNRTPQIRNVVDGTALYDIPAHGNGVRWEAECADDASGRAHGADLDVAGAESAASTTVGRLDKRTGRYTGTSRALVAGLRTASGTLDLVSSVMQVDALPGREPTISYRIATADGTLAAGLEVPSRELTKQFNDSVRNNAGAVAALGPLGLTLMGPTVSASERGGAVLNAPFLELTVGLESRRGTLGQNNHLRLVNVDFEGGYFQ
jgi:hypothetical protein